MKVEAFISAVTSSIVLVVTLVLQSMTTEPLEGAVIEIAKETPVGWMVPVAFAIIAFFGVFTLLLTIA